MLHFWWVKAQDSIYLLLPRYRPIMDTSASNKTKTKVAMAKMLMLMHQKDNNTNQKVTSQWLHPCLIGCSTFALMLWADQQTTWLHHFQITQFLFFVLIMFCNKNGHISENTHSPVSLLGIPVKVLQELLIYWNLSTQASLRFAQKGPKQKTSSDHLWVKIPGWYRTRAGQLKANKKATITQINALVLM